MPKEFQHSDSAWLGKLLQQFRAGNVEALGEVIERHRDFLFRHADRLFASDLRCREGISDIVQEASLAAHQNLLAFKGTTESEFRAWLLAILSNQAANRANRHRAAMRDVRREVKLNDSSLGNIVNITDARPSPSSMAARCEEKEILGTQLNCLSEAIRQVIELHYRDHLSFDEIARRLSKTTDAVKKLWARGVDRLSGSD